MSFSFFGVFTDRSPGLVDEFLRCWPSVDIVEITEPFPGIAVRFSRLLYTPAEEDIPESVCSAVQEISRKTPSARFVLLRTECWGGICGNWGKVIIDGNVVVDEPCAAYPQGKGTLRRLIGNFGVDIGTLEIFDPLSRDFPWGLKESV
jgi:hypothetical protein